MSEVTAGVDIVIPYYGPRDRLKETVRSVLAQDSDSWRLVVVEDGDQGQDVGQWLTSLHDPRVRHLLNRGTLGIPGNFQRCLEVAEAAYVTFVGCDDRLLPTYVKTMLDLTRRFPGADALMPGVRLIDADGAPTRTVTDGVKSLLRPRAGTARLLQGEPLLVSLLHGNWTYFPATCWRRDTIARLGFRPDLPTTLDLDLLARLVLQDGTVAVTHRVAFEYRRHGDSASVAAARDTARFEEERRLFGEIATACDERGWSRASRAARWHLTSRAHASLRRTREWLGR